MIESRRKLLKAIVSISALLPTLKAIAVQTTVNLTSDADSNFKYIYGNADYKNTFYQFLVNVFHLYPELEFHQLIELITKRSSSDQDIYLEVQKNLMKSVHLSRP